MKHGWNSDKREGKRFDEVAINQGNSIFSCRSLRFLCSLLFEDQTDCMSPLIASDSALTSLEHMQTKATKN